MQDSMWSSVGEMIGDHIVSWDLVCKPKRGVWVLKWCVYKHLFSGKVVMKVSFVTKFSMAQGD